MTGRLLPAGRVSKVTSPAGIRYARPRPGGRDVLVPGDGEAAPASDADAEHFAETAPDWVRQCWRLAEAARWGWELWQLPCPADGPGCGHGPVGWGLLIDTPGGVVHRYEYIKSGDRWEPAAQTEYAVPPPGREAVPAERG